MKKAHTGHRGDSGIQEHSCGPIFPYHIVQKGNNALFAMHADGTELDHHLFDRQGEKRYNQDHKAAHHRATEQARVALAGEAEAARDLNVVEDFQLVQIPISRQTSKAS